MRRQHDPFLKRLYREGTRDAFSLFFPHLAARIDWSHWRWIDKEISLPGRRPHSLTADLVAETRDVDGRYLKVLVHPELQMTPDPEMDERALEYNAGLMLREGGRRTRVLTLVFYHCAGTGGIQERRAVLEFYGTEVHTVTYWSVGLGELEAAAYAERENPMGWALASWMRQQRDRRVELRLHLLEKILRFVEGEEYQELLLDTVQTYYKLSGRERRAEERLLESGRYGEVKEMAQTVMERKAARARQEAMQLAVREVIRTRFPGAPESVTDPVARIRKVATLETLLRRVTLAASLEEIERLLAEPNGA
jgi:hypothetical protein